MLLSLQLPQPVRKDSSGKPQISAAYEPLPAIPVQSTALSQGPSRVVHKLSNAFMTSYQTSNITASSLHDNCSNVLAMNAIEIECTKASKTNNGACSIQESTCASPLSVLDSLHSDKSDAVKADIQSFNYVLNTKRKHDSSSSSTILDFNTVTVAKKEPSAVSKYDELNALSKKRKITVTANKGNTDENAAPSSSVNSKADSMKSVGLYLKKVRLGFRESNDKWVEKLF